MAKCLGSIGTPNYKNADKLLNKIVLSSAFDISEMLKDELLEFSKKVRKTSNTKVESSGDRNNSCINKMNLIYNFYDPMCCS